MASELHVRASPAPIALLPLSNLLEAKALRPALQPSERSFSYWFAPIPQAFKGANYLPLDILMDLGHVVCL